ncbi:hypothetical protein [Desulfonatronospira sp.]|uniref:hypothetical protein n=1 Tax=Desulfonatronospira sp. TaxID=1962951 RepID=UPI0025C44729|nr:hypothetical protein [Desulfonatronospira sp.]
MDKERIKELAENPDFIPGIYNYCDRWCERCAFTSRCMNFAMEQEFFQEQKSSDEMNAAFWESISNIFEVTISLLYDLAQERGIDLDAAREDQDAKHEQAMQRARKHICTILAQRYREMAKEWLESSEVWTQDMAVKIPGVISAGEAPGLQEAREIIYWYLFLIEAKIVRALHGKAEEEECELESYGRDADGSAKVALMGIERSLAAWGVVHEIIDHDRHGVQNILFCLDRLRRKLEAVFPQARDFVRPGFDD